MRRVESCDYWDVLGVVSCCSIQTDKDVVLTLRAAYVAHVSLGPRVSPGCSKRGAAYTSRGVALDFTDIGRREKILSIAIIVLQAATLSICGGCGP